MDLRPFTRFALSPRQKVVLCDRVLAYTAAGTPDFNALKKRLERMDRDAVIEIGKSIVSAKKALLDYVRATFNSKTTSMEWVGKLQIRNWADVRSAFREMSRMAFTAGRRDLRREVSGAIAMAEPFTPIAAARFMDERMFWISGVLRDDLTRKAQGLLTRAIQFGEPLDDVVGKLADLFAPYILEGVAPEVATPFRLETIVRTNMTEAYNMGRLADVHDPDMALYIEGVRYSAILDTRTTPICAFLHDKVFKPDDPELDRLAPANHFNCRSILVPVIVGERIDEDAWITEAEKQEALDMIKVGFGGNDPEYTERAALPRFYKENDDAQSHAD